MRDKSETGPAKSSCHEGHPAAERSIAPIWNPRDEIDELFEGFFDGGGFAPFRRRHLGRPRQRAARGFSLSKPTIDVIDKEDAVKICAELPGMAKDDIDVRVTISTLVLWGEKKDEPEEGDAAKDVNANAGARQN